jgi:hypothetical protein
MAIRLFWDNPEQTILRMEITGRWSWEEMYEASENSILMRQTVNHPVASIVDFSDALGIPDSAIAHGKNIMDKQDVYGGVTVFVQPDFAFMSLWEVMMKIYGRWVYNIDFIFAKSVDEAREIALKRTQSRPVAKQSG